MVQCSKCLQAIDDVDSPNIVRMPGRRVNVTTVDDETTATVEGVPTYYHRRCPSLFGGPSPDLSLDG